MKLRKNKQTQRVELVLDPVHEQALLRSGQLAVYANRGQTMLVPFESFEARTLQHTVVRSRTNTILDYRGVVSSQDVNNLVVVLKPLVFPA